MPLNLRAALFSAVILITSTQALTFSLGTSGGEAWAATALRTDGRDDRDPSGAAQLLQQRERLLRLRARDGRFLSPIVRDGVPEGVSCNVTERCDSRNVCARVCERGSVDIDPWLRFAVEYQWRLSRRQPLCFAQLLGTHNSAITLADGYGMHDEVYTLYLQYLGLASTSQHLVTSNQALSLTDQLNLGVRFLELDVHWIQSGLHIAHCGGFHSPSLNQLVRLISHLARLFGHPPVEWDAETVGCDPSMSSLPVGDQRSFSDALSEVADWLLSNPATAPDEFLVLYLDDQPDLAVWGRVGELLEQVVAAIPPGLIISPPELRNITQQLGYPPSVDELVHVYGKRLLLMSGADYGEAMSGLAFSHHSLCNLDEPLFRGFSGPPNCSFHNLRYDMDTPVMTGRMFRTPTCHLTYGPYNCSLQRGENTPQLDPDLLPRATSCGINVPAPDMLTPELVQSYIWSWAPGHAPPPPPSPPMTSVSTPAVVKGSRWWGPAAGVAVTEAGAAAGATAAAATCVLMRSSDGRWVVQPTCQGARYVTCRRDAGPQHLPGAAAWVLADPGPDPDPHPESTAAAAAAGSTSDVSGASSCPPGYVLSAPHTARENWELWGVVTSQRGQQQGEPGGAAGAEPAAAAELLVVLTLDPVTWVPADLTRGGAGPPAS